MKIRFQVENNGIVIGAGVIDIDEAVNVGGGVGLIDTQTIAHKIAIQDILARVVTLEHELKELKLQKFEEIYDAIKKHKKHK